MENSMESFGVIESANNLLEVKKNLENQLKMIEKDPSFAGDAVDLKRIITNIEKRRLELGN